MANRDDLNKEATELGLNPADYPNIDAITAAINERKAMNEDAAATTAEAPKLTEATEVEFEHEDGQRYGGSYKAFTELYEPMGFTLVARADGQPLGESEG